MPRHLPKRSKNKLPGNDFKIFVDANPNLQTTRYINLDK
jgi:hypothetical protein